MDESISQFVSITGADADKAKFYVEAAKGDVQEAVSTFFEAEGGKGHDEEERDQTTIAEAAMPTGPRTLSGAPAPPMPEGWAATAATSSRSTRSGVTAGGAGAGSSRLATLSDYRGDAGERNGPGDDDDEEGDDDDRDPLNFFAGGERSGLSVQNPNHGKKRGGAGAPDVVQDILQRAREMAQRRMEGGGSTDDEDDDDDAWGQGGPGAPTSRAAGSSSAPSFRGQGRTLADAASSEQSSATASGGGAGGDTTTVPGSFQLEAGQPGGASADPPADMVANRRIIFWQDGFSLEDGPLCRYDDPQHAHTLSMINQGAAPLSFLNVRFGQRVNLTVEQRQEKYKPPPPPPMKPFGGQGNRLGAPGAASLTSSSAQSSLSTAAPPTQSAEAATASPLKVDDAQPTTQLQIRLADGQRLVGRFNLTHTVADVRRYIESFHPAEGRSYALSTSFPPKAITDEAQTLQEAGLANAVVIQKWT